MLDQAELEELDLLEELIGRTGTLGLAHQSTQNGQIRAVVTSIMLPRRGTAERMQTATAPIAFGLEDGLDRKAYDDLPEWLRNIVARSPEYQKAVAPEKAHDSTDERVKTDLGAATRPATVSEVHGNLDDEIPF